MTRSATALSDNDLLDFHVVAVDEADHVDARSDVELALVAAAEGVAADHVAEGIHHLNGGLTFDAEDAEVTHAVDEGEAVAVNAAAGGEHQAEAAGIVGGLGVEGVARGYKYFSTNSVGDRISILAVSASR